MQIGTPESGDFHGYEVDLLQKLAKRLDFSIQYRRALWSVIFGELSSGGLDLVCSAATVTAERAREVDFCAPHLKLSLALVTREELSADLDISASRVGVRHGTTAAAYLLHSSAERRLRPLRNDLVVKETEYCSLLHAALVTEVKSNVYCGPRALRSTLETWERGHWKHLPTSE